MKSILKSPMYYKTSILIRQKVKRLLCIKRERMSRTAQREIQILGPTLAPTSVIQSTSFVQVPSKSL